MLVNTAGACELPHHSSTTIACYTEFAEVWAVANSSHSCAQAHPCLARPAEHC